MTTTRRDGLKILIVGGFLSWPILGNGQSTANLSDVTPSITGGVLEVYEYVIKDGKRILHGERQLNLPPYRSDGCGSAYVQTYQNGVLLVGGTFHRSRFRLPSMIYSTKNARKLKNLSGGWQGTIGVDGTILERFSFPTSPNVVLTGERRITLPNSILGTNDYVEGWVDGKIVSIALEYRATGTGKIIRTVLSPVARKDGNGSGRK